MLESTIHSILLALHNLALVGCAAAPFYNRNLVNQRAQYGPRLYYELDKVVEDTLQGNATYCVVFLAVLFATGIGMPLNHYAFHGKLVDLPTIAAVALAVKLLFVFGMMVIMGVIFLSINPKLLRIWAGFTPESAPDPEAEKAFFALRAKRKQLCEVCLGFAVVVLVASAFLGFGR